jgi:hypothetical protein
MGFLGFRPVLNPTIERSLRRLWRWFGTGFGAFIDQAKRAVASKRYYGLPDCRTSGRRTGSPWYVWPTDWKSIVRLADGLEVHRTSGRGTRSRWYVWPTDWKSIVRLAEGLEVGGTFGRRTGSPSYVWPTDWKSVVRLADGLEVGGTFGRRTGSPSYKERSNRRGGTQAGAWHRI